MKMKRNVILIVGLLFASTALSEERVIPSLDKLEAIVLRLGPGGWDSAVFLPNGAARLNHDLWGFWTPEGSFSFEEIYNFIVPHLIQDGYADRDVSVWLYTGQTSTWAMHLRGRSNEVFRTLMHGIRDKVVKDSTYAEFEQLLKKHPLVPGDPPYVPTENRFVEVAHDDLESLVFEWDMSTPDPESDKTIPLETSPVTTPDNEKDEKQSRPWLILGIGILLGLSATAYFVRRKATKHFLH